MSDTSSQSPSDHLLRTLAAVPVESRVLHLGCADVLTTEHLARLGFDLYACDVDVEAVLAARERLSNLELSDPSFDADERVTSATAVSLSYPDDFFDWVVAHDTYNRAPTLENVMEMVQETRRVLKPGGWVHCTVPAEREQLDQWDRLDSVVYQNGSAIGAFFSSENLDELMTELEFARAVEPFSTTVEDSPYLCAVYRKVDDDTPA